MAAMAITQQDIARRLNVSRSTVKGVVNNDRSVRVAPDTRRRVLEAVVEMGYVPQAAGQMLRRGRTNTISFAYVKSDYGPSRSWHAQAIEAAAEFLSEHGYDLKVKAYNDNNALLDWLPTMARSRSCDASMVCGLEPDVEAQGALLESLGFPFVAFGDFEAAHPNWIQAFDDHTGMIRRAVEKLVSLGHTRIAFLGHDHDMGYARKHREGFAAAVSDTLGCDTPGEWILLNGETAETHLRIERQVTAWAQMPPSERPTALAACQGWSVLRAVELTLLQHGISIGHQPGQLTIAGLSDDGHMLVSRGWRFCNDMRDGVINHMVRDQMMPLLQDGQPKQQIIRYLPDLAMGTNSIIYGWNIGIPTRIVADVGA